MRYEASYRREEVSSRAKARPKASNEGLKNLEVAKKYLEEGALARKAV